MNSHALSNSKNFKGNRNQLERNFRQNSFQPGSDEYAFALLPIHYKTGRLYCDRELG